MSRTEYDPAKRGRPPTDAALILDRGGELWFPGTLPAEMKRSLNRPTGYLRKRGKHAESFWSVRRGVPGFSVHAIPDDAPNDGTWGLVEPRLSGEHAPSCRAAMPTDGTCTCTFR